MRWFKRESKDEPPSISEDEKDTTTTSDAIVDEQTSESNTEQVAPTEPAPDNVPKDTPDPRIEKANHELDALYEKITSVKKEYDEAVGRLFDVKDELASKRRESTAANATCEALQKRIATLNSQLAESDEHRSQVRTSNKTRQDATRELEKVNKTLDQKQQEIESANKKLVDAAAELGAIAEKEKESQAKIVEAERLFEKTQIMIKDTNISRPAPKGDLVRTASSMIASLNAKLAKANKEIQVLHDIIERERRQRTQS